jgi:hypothetical protein
VLKKVLEKVVDSDYQRGKGLRHYITKPPPIPVDETCETIKKLNLDVSRLKTERDHAT